MVQRKNKKVPFLLLPRIKGATLKAILHIFLKYFLEASVLKNWQPTASRWQKLRTGYVLIAIPHNV